MPNNFHDLSEEGAPWLGTYFSVSSDTVAPAAFAADLMGERGSGERREGGVGLSWRMGRHGRKRITPPPPKVGDGGRKGWSVVSLFCEKSIGVFGLGRE